MILTHALSVQQPWASALVRRVQRKPLENRYKVDAFKHPPFRVEAGTWIGIHASATTHRLAHLCPDADPDAPRSALVGAVHVVGWLRASEALQRPDLAPWVHHPSAAELDVLEARRGRPVARESWCLVTDAAVQLADPIPMPGALGLWWLPKPIEIPDPVRRGRPPLPPDQRAPRRSGPSGQPRRVEGEALLEQRRRILADLLAAVPQGSDLAQLLAAVPVEVPSARLPHGAGARLAAIIGWPARAGADRLSKVWAGKLTYRPVAKIF